MDDDWNDFDTNSSEIPWNNEAFSNEVTNRNNTMNYQNSNNNLNMNNQSMSTSSTNIMNNQSQPQSYHPSQPQQVPQPSHMPPNIFTPQPTSSFNAMNNNNNTSINPNTNLGTIGENNPNKSTNQSFSNILFNSALNSKGSSNPLAQAGMIYGQQFINNNMSGVKSYATNTTDKLRYYFKVDNNYVLSKLKILLFPFITRDWNRKLDYDNQSLTINNTSYKPPSYDTNAPDLYIPSMSFISFVLLMGYTMGLAGKFNPEIIATYTSSTMILLLLEIIIVRFGFSFLGANNISSIHFMDYISYCGYKYVSLIINILIGQFSSMKLLFYISLFWFSGICNSYFLYNTLNIVIQFPTHNIRKKYFLFILLILQFLICYYLVIDAIPNDQVQLNQI